MSKYWMRINGQVELRENVRKAIKQAGLTQHQAATMAGMKYARLVGCLGKNSWWDLREVYAIGKVVKVPAHELIGDSIFKGDPREQEFNFAPSSSSRSTRGVPPKIPAVQGCRERAICCSCGTLRLWATNTQGSTYLGDLEPHGRMLKDLACATCGESTRHALLRDGAHKDVAEEQDRAPSASARACRERDAFVQRMRGFNVEVTFRRIKPLKSADKAPVVDLEYDHSKSQWRFEVNEAAPALVQLEVLRRTWSEVATGEFSEGVTWDPQESGIWAYASQNGWGEATDELVSDLTRFLDVERRRLVQDINDEVSRQEFSVDENGAAR